MGPQLLIEWMSHRGEGRWSAFKDSVIEVYGSEDPPSPYAVANGLSMMGIADFFMGGAPRWSVFSPVLGGLAGGGAALLGGRSKSSLAELETACGTEGASLTALTVSLGIAWLRVEGTSDEGLARIAEKVRVPFVPDVAIRLLVGASSVKDEIEGAQRMDRPYNWPAKSYDLEAMDWTDEDIPCTAKKFTPAYGVSRFALQRRDGLLIEMERRTSVYAAACQNGVSLLAYDPDSRTLRMPASAPLPAPLARAAVIGAQSLPKWIDGKLHLENVCCRLAFLLIGRLGGALPGLAISRSRGIR